MKDKKIKVLYIAGWGRSGSTILASVLGQIEGFFTVGELSYIGDRGIEQNRLCGCGERFHSCNVWQEILQEAFGGIDKINPNELKKIRQRGSRFRHFPLLLTAFGRSHLYAQVKENLLQLEKLYSAIQFITGCRIIVESSKNPAYAFWLAQIPNIDLYVIHLVRDARATAHSWQRRKYQPDTPDLDYMYRMSIIRSAIMWDAYASMVEWQWQGSPEYLRLHYERFAVEPGDALQAILDLLVEKDVELPFVDHRVVALAPTHTISGNPNRFQTGLIKLQLDDQWKKNMRLQDKVTVTALTWPLLLKYSYWG